LLKEQSKDKNDENSITRIIEKLPKRMKEIA